MYGTVLEYRYYVIGRMCTRGVGKSLANVAVHVAGHPARLSHRG